MSWGSQNRSEDAKTPSGSRGRSDKPELGLWPVQPYLHFVALRRMQDTSSSSSCVFVRNTEDFAGANDGRCSGNGVPSRNGRPADIERRGCCCAQCYIDSERVLE
jgi:hypothetical protein